MAGSVGDFPLKDKIVLITGGGSGIGLALAQQCHDQGAKVLIGDLNLTSAADKWIRQTSGHQSSSTGGKVPGVCYAKCDVTSWSSLRSLIDTSVTTFGDVPDVYVPSAGVFEPPWSNFWDDTEATSSSESSYKQLRINVDHPVQLTRLAIRALLGADKKGVVCLVASGAGLVGNYLSSLYCASKHAVVGLAKSLGPTEAQEGVKIVCICPGMVLSPLWTDRTDDKAEAFNALSVPALNPGDIAETIIRMVTEGKYAGGTVLVKAVGIEDVVHQGGEEGQPRDDQGRVMGDFEKVKKVLSKERGVKWKA